jgi:hypothetical protein
VTSECKKFTLNLKIINFASPTARFTSLLSNNGMDDGCDVAGNFAFVLHDLRESVDTAWVPITVRSLLQHRKGCVYVMDYSHFANVTSISSLTPHFDGIAAVLTTKLQNVGNFDREYIFGHGFGSRLAVEAGMRVGHNSIDRMDLCDPTGEFDVEVLQTRNIYKDFCPSQDLSMQTSTPNQQPRTLLASIQATIKELTSTTATRTSAWVIVATHNLLVQPSLLAAMACVHISTTLLSSMTLSLITTTAADQVGCPRTPPAT